MKHYFILMMLIEWIQFCSCEVKSLKRQKVISRKKRYLSFPEGSSVVLNLSFANSYIWDYSPLPRPSWNSLCEADIGFRLPNTPRPFVSKKPGKSKRRSSDVYRLQRSEQLELFSNIEALLDVEEPRADRRQSRSGIFTCSEDRRYGVNGRPCILRTLCEAKERLKPGKSLVEDILHVVFTIPEGHGDEFEEQGYGQPASEEFCKSLGKRCPFSLLEYLLYN